MADKYDEPEYTKVKIIMDRDFEEFTKEKEDEFLDDIAKVSRSSKKKIRDKKYRRGCVVFEAELPKLAAVQLLKLFQSQDSDSDSDELKEFIKVMEKHNIWFIRGQRNSKVDIITSRKSESKDGAFARSFKDDANKPEKMADSRLSEFCSGSAIYPNPIAVFYYSHSARFLLNELAALCYNNYSLEMLLARQPHLVRQVAWHLFLSQAWHKDRPDIYKTNWHYCFSK